MNKNKLLQMFPSDREVAQAIEVWSEHNTTTKPDIRSFICGINWLREFLLAKLPDLTEAELLAIEEYKTGNKVEAVKFLMKENNIGLKTSKDFLDYHNTKVDATKEALVWWEKFNLESKFYKVISWLKAQNLDTTSKHPHSLTNEEIRDIWEFHHPLNIV